MPSGESSLGCGFLFHSYNLLGDARCSNLYLPKILFLFFIIILETMVLD
uniref:Uncharacterized protein n=1 Tax=Rhizophora mucronata TaxID=61149 RepID=A0A2P2JV23_RHIMU